MAAGQGNLSRHTTCSNGWIVYEQEVPKYEFMHVHLGVYRGERKDSMTLPRTFNGSLRVQG